jgi:hypothetical protein
MGLQYRAVGNNWTATKSLTTVDQMVWRSESNPGCKDAIAPHCDVRCTNSCILHGYIFYILRFCRLLCFNLQGFFFQFCETPRLALGPTRRPIQWVHGAFSTRVKRSEREAHRSPPYSLEVKNEWSYTPPPHTFMARTGNIFYLHAWFVISVMCWTYQKCR